MMFERNLQLSNSISALKYNYPRKPTNYHTHRKIVWKPHLKNEALWIDWKSSADADETPFKFTGKELDAETGLYYYGARYLDPKTSRWMSTDPAMGEYLPSAPINEEAKKRNGNLPGMGGVFNYVNLHVYHYAGNNPVKYVDPDGRLFDWYVASNVKDQDFINLKKGADDLKNSDTEAGRRFRELSEDKNVNITIYVGQTGASYVDPKNPKKMANGKGSDSNVYIYINETTNAKSSLQQDFGVTLAHEVSGHAYDIAKGIVPMKPKTKFHSPENLITERRAVAMQNEYSHYKGLDQRRYYNTAYGQKWDMPIFGNTGWKVLAGNVGKDGYYKRTGNYLTPWSY